MTDWLLIVQAVCVILAIMFWGLGLLFLRKGRWHSQQAADVDDLRHKLMSGELPLDEGVRQFEQIRARRFVWWDR